MRQYEVERNKAPGENLNRRASSGLKEARLASTTCRHRLQRLLPRQSAQALPDLREARLVRVLCGISSLNL